MKSDEFVEVTHDYYSIDVATNNGYYFREDADVYGNARLAGRGGAWLSGVICAKFRFMVCQANFYLP